MALPTSIQVSDLKICEKTNFCQVCGRFLRGNMKLIYHLKTSCFLKVIILKLYFASILACFTLFSLKKQLTRGEIA